jgi:hypothetical protein
MQVFFNEGSETRRQVLTKINATSVPKPLIGWPVPALTQVEMQVSEPMAENKFGSFCIPSGV